MYENNAGGSVPEGAGMPERTWANNALKIAEQEIMRLKRLGWIPYTLDLDDLRSESNEILMGVWLEPEANVRVRLRSRLTDVIKREFMKQRAELPEEFRPRAERPFSVGAIEFSQMTVCLTPKQLEAVNLVYLCGETESTAAVLLGISQQAFTFRLTAAIGRMKTFLQNGLGK